MPTKYKKLIVGKDVFKRGDMGKFGSQMRRIDVEVGAVVDVPNCYRPIKKRYRKLRVGEVITKKHFIDFGSLGVFSVSDKDYRHWIGQKVRKECQDYNPFVCAIPSRRPAKSLAERAYEKFYKVYGGKHFPWNKCPKEIKKAWMAAIRFVQSQTRKERK